MSRPEESVPDGPAKPPSLRERLKARPRAGAKPPSRRRDLAIAITVGLLSFPLMLLFGFVSLIGLLALLSHGAGGSAETPLVARYVLPWTIGLAGALGAITGSLLLIFKPRGRERWIAVALGCLFIEGIVILPTLKDLLQVFSR